MKHSIFVVLLMASVTLYGQNTLTIHQKNGEKFSYGFEEKPLVVFSETEMIVKSTKVEVRYQIDELAKFTFDDKETDVESISENCGKATITLDEYFVSITGIKANSEVRLTTADGKQLHTYRSNDEGYVTFSIADLINGVYLISSDSLTVKIIKK